MRAVIQRVSRARVIIDREQYSVIGSGVLILLGVEKGDTPEEAVFLSRKIAELRIFEDEAGKMNRSLIDASGEALVVSQFTLLGDTRKGRRPSFDDAAPPAVARELYEQFVVEMQLLGIRVSTGVFQAMMSVELTNQGPVTFVLDSRKRA